jgi:3-oxoacid CoA-transferase subunit A
MATAAKTTICEVEEIVEIGQLNSDNIHTPGIFVDRLIQGDKYEKRIEKVTTRNREAT